MLCGRSNFVRSLPLMGHLTAFQSWAIFSQKHEGSEAVSTSRLTGSATRRKVARRPLWMLASATIVGATTQSNPARADTAAALTAIADTADRICGIVVTQGEAGSSKVQGEIRAELNGLARRLANIGGSGTVDITSSKYQGLLQQDLPTTLKDIRECKLKVLRQLQATVLPGTAQVSGPSAPSSDLLQAPANAPTVDTVRPANQREELGLYNCTNQENNITCYLILSRLVSGQQDYRIDTMRIDQFKLVDNYHIEHRLKRAYFIDGLSNHQQTTNLSTGESVWLALEFESVAHPVSSARIILTSFPGAPQLRGPVN